MISPHASVREIHLAYEILRLSYLPINRDRSLPLSLEVIEQLQKIDRAFRLALDKKNPEDTLAKSPINITIKRRRSTFTKTPNEVTTPFNSAVEKSTLTVDELLQRVEAQDFNAAYILGLKYENGDGVEDHCIEAARWYATAAKHGHTMAKYRLGLLYKSGLGVIRNLKLAQTWIQSAVNDGWPPAIKEQVEIARLIREEKQLAEFQFLSGVKCETGEGLVSNDYREAARLYHLAAQRDHRKAQYNLSLLYRQGLGVAKDLAEADKWLSRSRSTAN